MANLKVKRSSVPSKIPSITDLGLGELAVNTYDGKLFLKKSVSGVESIVDITSGTGGGGSSGVAAVSDSAPSSPSQGTLWFDSTSGLLRVYYADGTSNQWIDTTGTTTGSLTSSSINTALGYVPQATLVSGTNIKTINGTSLLGSGDITITAGVSSFNTRTGAITLTSSDVTTALTFTPYSAANPAGYISSITSGNVTTALGFTPYNATNPANYISGITSSDVITALTFTPQVALVSGTNIKTINGTSLLGSGDITISGGSGSLPIATSTVLGGVKIGSNLSITAEGVLSASGASEPILNQFLFMGI